MKPPNRLLHEKCSPTNLKQMQKGILKFPSGMMRVLRIRIKHAIRVAKSSLLGANNNVGKQSAYYVKDKGDYCECVTLLEILEFAYDDYLMKLR